MAGPCLHGQTGAWLRPERSVGVRRSGPLDHDRSLSVGVSVPHAGVEAPDDLEINLIVQPSLGQESDPSDG